MASSSSAINDCDNYDVFLSFRGEDTRYSFTSHLHKALLDHNIKVFIDYNIRRGTEITLAIERVIEDSKMFIIVFSKNYAESTFCLDELLKIMECRESKEQIVLPIFYKVVPSKEIYEEAFARHEQNIKQKMVVEKWKSAFCKALGLAGEPLDDKCNEAEKIEKITCEVLATLKELNTSLSKGEELICTLLDGQTTENTFKKIWECLMNDEISRVGVYGMGGVGKTTIAIRINNQLLEVANSFTHIYWVTVSKDSSIYKLQSGIAKKINLDLSKEDDEKRRAAMIRKELSNKKFLLILDDVWEPYELTKDVGLPDPLVGGQKILLTTRRRRVCARMKFLLIEVKPLSQHEALHLFVKESNYQINDSREWKDIVRGIVKECAGLPLAVVVVARMMRGVVEISEWRNTLRELRKPYEEENPEMEEKVFKVLKVSYDRLPNDRCRQCFLYCSLFPEDHQFYGYDLIDYWIGEGLIDELDSRQAEFDKGNVILNELVHSSLLESIDDPRYSYLLNYDHASFRQIKMHDVIRDMARSIVKVGLQLQYTLESVQVQNRTMLKSFLYSSPYCTELKTLVWHDDDIKELSGCFFASMQSLNVLHMRFVDSVKSIPNSITNLGNLRVLIIIDCMYLECLPSLAGLENLRHLTISRNMRLKEISKGLERLVNLRVLDLSQNWSIRLSFSSGVVEKLSYLQTLDLRGTNFITEPELLINLEKLEIVRVHFYNFHQLNCYVNSGHWRRLLDYQFNVGTFSSEDWKKLTCLRAIRDIKKWNGQSGIFLPDNVQNLDLTEWRSEMFKGLKNPTFSDLQTITIWDYQSRYLFSVDLAQQLLHNVQHLRINISYELEEIIGREEEWGNGSNCINHSTIVLPNLKRLTLFVLRELRSIYRGKMVCPSLELVELDNCDKLERLPFCMENKQNPTIKLEGYDGNCVKRMWWDSLLWDDPNTKSMYEPKFHTESVSESDYESESEPEYGDE